MSNTSTAIQFLRTTVPQLRPSPHTLSEGMPCLNLHEGEPGLFFSLRDGELCKIGPVALGDQPPNSGAQGFQGNCKGETWVDTSNSGSPLLKVFDGSDWLIPFQSPTAVTSVGLQVSTTGLFNVANSPITSSGNLVLEILDQPVNHIFAGPSSGVAGLPSFRTLTQLDIPELGASKITSGTLSVDRIPNLPGSKITSGLLPQSVIPGLSATKINSGVLPYAFGGTGVSSQPLDGELLIGGISTGWKKTTLTAGNNIVITNGPGSISISSTPSSSPGGSNTEIQFNNSGLIAGDPDFTYNPFSSRVTLNGDLIIGGTGLVEVDGEINLPDQSEIKFGDQNLLSVSLKSPSTLDENYTLFFPVDKGNTGDLLVNSGSGQLAFTSTVSVTNLRKVETVSSSVTLQESTETVFIDAPGTITITLPTPEEGRYIALIRRDTNPFVVTIGGTIDGVSNPTDYFPHNHTNKQRLSIYSDGTSWYSCGFTVK